MLSATVLNLGSAVPEFLNEAPSTVDIEFSEAITGFDTSDLLLTVNDGTGVRRIEDLAGLSLTTSDGGTNWQLENLASLTAAEGEYQLTLDVLDSGIVDVANELLAMTASISRAQKNLCGGGNTAIEPPAVSTMARRLRERRATGWLLGEPPNSYFCQSLEVSRQTTRGASAVRNPFRPPAYLYATLGSSVFAMAS